MLFLSKSLVAACLAGAASADPNEFIGLIEGEKKKTGDLLLTRLVVAPGLSVDSDSAHFSDWMVPPSINHVGVFHSHPSYSNRPSRADLLAAGKEGGVQLIACRPYTPQKLAAYDLRGKQIPYWVVP